jgi:hypothetical protein
MAMNQIADLQYCGPLQIREGGTGFQVEDASGRSLFYVPFEDDFAQAMARRRMNRKQARATALKVMITLAELHTFRAAIDKVVADQSLQPLATG